MPPRVVLWDFDGTLADSSGDVWESLEYAAALCGGSFPEDVAGRADLLSLGVRELLAYAVPSPDVGVAELFEHSVSHHYRQVCRFRRTRLYPGILDLLGRLRGDGVIQWIVTDKPRAALERVLASKGWGRLFDGWVCSDADGRDGGVPKGELIGRVLGRLGVPPSECVMVGDSPTDVLGARECGVDSVGVTYGDGDSGRLRCAGPTFCVGDCAQLAVLLTGLDRRYDLGL